MDKVLHFFVCFFSTLLISIAMFWMGMWHAVISGALFALGLGLGKEYGDSKATGNHWCWWDILVDLLGIVVAAGTLILGWCD